MRPSYRKAALGAALVLAVPFLQGLWLETRVDDALHSWSRIIEVIMLPWLVVLLAALAFTLRRDMGYAVAIVMGVTMGFAGGVFLLAGDFAPYGLQVGGRRLAEFGDALEVQWDWVLAALAIVIGVMGALAGAVCGPAVLAVKRLFVARTA